jgi:hypothetical protein
LWGRGFCYSSKSGGGIRHWALGTGHWRASMGFAVLIPGVGNEEGIEASSHRGIEWKAQGECRIPMAECRLPVAGCRLIRTSSGC